MPIKNTDSQGNVTVTHLGAVVKVIKSVKTRNHSDTLDYSDHREMNCTEALVYVGRVAPPCAWMPPSENNMPRPVPLMQRFHLEDCTNIFVWRGSPHREPTVDLIFHPDLVEDWCLFQEETKRLEGIAAAETAARVAAEQQARIEAERNRPVTGKKMKVVKGRKVPVGTVGVVAYIHANGGVLLKAESEWRNRNAPGIWVNASNLAAV